MQCFITGSYGNGGEHGHGHHHHHDHDHGADIDGGEDLESLIKNFGIAVLGKDQESADDVQPTADHSHVNIKALINELFHPSSTSTTTTTTPLTTSTQRLPIKDSDATNTFQIETTKILNRLLHFLEAALINIIGEVWLFVEIGGWHLPVIFPLFVEWFSL